MKWIYLCKCIFCWYFGLVIMDEMLWVFSYVCGEDFCLFKIEWFGIDKDSVSKWVKLFVY